ncbi:MAG: HAD family hydrolase [Dehalococcoidia bacterium]|nr:HAD family hydrolase [Dehalococcoidia bacterium]
MTPARPAGNALPAGLDTVLFDLDGTLVDSAAIWREAMGATFATAFERYPQLRALGSADEVYDRVLWPAAAERGAGVGGEWSDDFLHHAFRRLLAEHATADDAFAAELMAQYERVRSAGTYQLYPDVAAALDSLLGRYRLGLITNGPSENQRSRIAPLGLDRYFKSIAVSGELGIRKPDPAIFNQVLHEISAQPSTAVYIGDSLGADVAGAHAAGVAAVWINRTGAPRDDAPDATITTLDELLPLLVGAIRSP